MPDQPPKPPEPSENEPESTETDSTSKASEPPAADPPAPPPPQPPSTPPPPTAQPPSPGASTNTVMLVLAYVWILALIPLLTEQDDADVQWHAKNGIVLMLAEIALWILMTILQFLPFLGWLLGCGLMPLIFLAIVVIRILCIVKAVNGQKLRLPVLDGFVEQWK